MSLHRAKIIGATAGAALAALVLMAPAPASAHGSQQGSSGKVTHSVNHQSRKHSHSVKQADHKKFDRNDHGHRQACSASSADCRNVPTSNTNKWDRDRDHVVQVVDNSMQNRKNVHHSDKHAKTNDSHTERAVVDCNGKSKHFA